MTRSAPNLMVVQGGGPTPVLNASLFGVIDQARQSGAFPKILGARNGVEGLINDETIDLGRISEAEVARLRTSPGASLGTTRHKLTDDNLDQIVQNLLRQNVRALLLIGGNGSLRGADLIARAAQRQGADICVVGIPKTIDNDIMGTDRCPGFGSAARYSAQAVRDLGMDVRALPQPVSIFETMGRSVGWIAGATVLAKLDEQHAPHLVYLPERAFDVERFLGDIDRVVTRHGWAVAVVSEGLKTASGQPVYETSDATQRDALNRALPGGVCVHLASVVTQRLKIRCRWEKPGLCGRASMLHASEQDLADAEMVGRAGVRAALENKHAHMVSLRPLDSAGDGWELVPLSASAGGERHVPPEWLEESDLSVNASFADYVRRITGPLVEYAPPLNARA